MLFHLSIDADDPKFVSDVLAKILGGAAFPFPPVACGSWVAMAGDARNTSVEVYPRGTEFVEALGDADAIGVQGVGNMRSATHFAIETRLSREEVFALAHRFGWPVKYRRRGGVFGVIEFWLEGTRMIEILTAEMVQEYLDAATLDGWKKMLLTSGVAH